jgi:hypothetical protein
LEPSPTTTSHLGPGSFAGRPTPVDCGIEPVMLGLTFGELFVVVFIFVAVVSAPYWPKAGEAISVALWRRSRGASRTSQSD